MVGLKPSKRLEYPEKTLRCSVPKSDSQVAVVPPLYLRIRSLACRDRARLAEANFLFATVGRVFPTPRPVRGEIRRANGRRAYPAPPQSARPPDVCLVHPVRATG